MNRSSGDGSPMRRADLRCAVLASKQWGLISRAQARAQGLSADNMHDRVRTGRWDRVLPGVFRIAGVPSSWHQNLMAACLWAGAHAAVSHRAAAALWGLDGCPPGIVELSTRSDRKARVPWIVLHRVSLLDGSEVTMRGAIPVTSPTRTLVDLCAVLDRGRVESAVDDALRRNLTSLSRLRWAARRLGGKGRGGARLLRGVLEERPRGYLPPASRLESRVQTLLREAGLPPPARQHEVRDRGKLLARVDFAYVEARLAIEADGYRYHSGRLAWQRDLTRRNALTGRGWRVLHVTAEDLSVRPHEVVAVVRRALAGDPADRPRHLQQDRVRDRLGDDARPTEAATMAHGSDSVPR